MWMGGGERMVGACQLVAAHTSGHVTPRGDALQAAHAAAVGRNRFYTHHERFGDGRRVEEIHGGRAVQRSAGSP